MSGDLYGQLVAVADRWDLDGLRHEVSEILSRVDEADRAFVPTRLVQSLEMFLDSYGAGGQREG